jgi:hypothetical protein
VTENDTISILAQKPEPTSDIPLPSREALTRLLALRATGGALTRTDVAELMEGAWWALHNLPEGVDFTNVTTRHPIQRVYFRAGLLACREYMARFVAATHPNIAESIRASWWPSLGPDPGAPRLFDFDELAEETEDGRYRSKVIDASVEALPVALGFLEGR